MSSHEIRTAKKLDTEEAEKLVDTYIKENNLVEAVNTLTEMINHYAKEKEFSKAEECWNRLKNEDPMALEQIISTRELIRHEKGKAIDKDHIRLWDKLYSKLNKDEVGDFYHSLVKHDFLEKRVLYAQGKLNDKLFFINSGKAVILYRKEGKNEIIKKIGPGEIAGKQSFFGITTCTETVVAVTEVNASILSKHAYGFLNKTKPSVCKKLVKHILDMETLSIDVQAKGLNRRAHKRYKARGKVSLTIIGKNGNPMKGSIAAELSDLSVGGLSLRLRLKKPEMAKSLFGRNCLIYIPSPEGNAVNAITQAGVILAVVDLYFNIYEVSIMFRNLINPAYVADYSWQSNLLY